MYHTYAVESAYLSHCVTADLATNEMQAEAQTFYEDLGALAKEKKSVIYIPTYNWVQSGK